MIRNKTETVVGFVVIAIAGFFTYTAYTGAELNKKAGIDSYELKINFDRVDGLNVGGDVKVSGLKVGTILDAQIDPKTYQAKVNISVDNSIKIPDDSSAEIISAGLLGDKYLSLVPGGSETYLKDGESIKFSQSSVSLEAMIGKFMFDGGGEKPKVDDSEKPEESF